MRPVGGTNISHCIDLRVLGTEKGEIGTSFGVDDKVTDFHGTRNTGNLSKDSETDEPKGRAGVPFVQLQIVGVRWVGVSHPKRPFSRCFSGPRAQSGPRR